MELLKNNIIFTNINYIVIKTDDMSYIAGWILNEYLRKAGKLVQVSIYDHFDGVLSSLLLQSFCEREDYNIFSMDVAHKKLLQKATTPVMLYTNKQYKDLPEKVIVRSSDDKTLMLPELVWLSLYGNLDEIPKWVRMHCQSCANKKNITNDHKWLMLYLHNNNVDDPQNIYELFNLFNSMSEKNLADLIAESKVRYPQSSQRWRGAFALNALLPYLSWKWSQASMARALTSFSVKDIKGIDLEYKKITHEYEEIKGE